MTNEGLLFRDLEADDTAALQSLVMRCYGERYFDALYFDADDLRNAIESKEFQSSIALNKDGKIVAYLGMRYSAGSPRSDSSLAVVDPDYRARGLLIEIGIRIFQTCIEMGLCGIYGTAVTVHTYTQKFNLRGGAAVTGVSSA